MKKIFQKDLCCILLLSMMFILCISALIMNLIVKFNMTLIIGLLIGIALLIYPLMFAFRRYVILTNVHEEEIQYGTIKSIKENRFFKILVIEGSTNLEIRCLISKEQAKKYVGGKASFVIDGHNRGYLIELKRNKNTG